MSNTTEKSGCDICGKRCRLTRKQHERYMKIPKSIDSVWHPCFDGHDARNRFFGTESEDVRQPAWIMFPEIPEEGKAPPRRPSLSREEEARMFLRYNYARHSLDELIRKQRKRPTGARALEMLEWHARVEEAREDLAAANLSLVVAMARRTRIPNVEFADLISEGNMALLRAIEKFDVSRGYKFSTYACRAILKAFNRIAGKTGRYVSRFGVSYDPDLERSDYDVRRHEMQLASAVEDLRETISRNSAGLSPVERTVVTERFGLNERGRGRTLAEVGRMVSLTSERVRQVQKAALAKIRQVLNERSAAV